MSDHAEEIAQTIVERWTHETNRAERIRDIATALCTAAKAVPVTRNRPCPKHADEGAIVIYCQTCLDEAIETALQEHADVLTADFAMQAEVLVEATTQTERRRQVEISTWADETFGNVSSHARLAARANEEMAELLRAATSDAAPEILLQEIADVVIPLFRLADRCGGDLMQAVDAKMAINRTREWNKDGTGHGYHVRTDSAAARRAVNRARKWNVETSNG